MSLTNLKKVRSLFDAWGTLNGEGLISYFSRKDDTGAKPSHIMALEEGGESDEGHGFPAQMTMRDVVALVVRPMTVPSRKSFVEHVGGGPPLFFVSHNWDATFYHFVESVQQHFNVHNLQNPDQTIGEDEAFYWVCSFANNQWEVDVGMGLGSSPLTGPFSKALAYVKQKGRNELVAIQEEGRGNMYTIKRTWCALEMYISLVLDIQITFAFGERSLYRNKQFVDIVDGRAVESATKFEGREVHCEFATEWREWTFESSNCFHKDKARIEATITPTFSYPALYAEALSTLGAKVVTYNIAKLTQALIDMIPAASYQKGDHDNASGGAFDCVPKPRKAVGPASDEAAATQFCQECHAS